VLNKISLVIHVDAQVITFLSVSEYKTKMELPIVIQVVNGDIPEINRMRLQIIDILFTKCKKVLDIQHVL
jgi:hypothetical protein